MNNKQRSPAMQFYFRQFAADDAVTSMDLDAVGAHILLMCAAGSASSGYEIPADDRAIRTRLRNPSDADFKRIKEQLLAGAWKVSADGTRWIQDGMKRSLSKQKEFSKLQKEKADKRWHDAKAMPESSRPGNAEAMPSSTSSSSSTSTNINTNKKKKSKAQKYTEFNQADFDGLSPATSASLKAWIDYKASDGTPCLLSSYQAQVVEFINQPDLYAKLVARSIRNGWKGLNEQIPFEQETNGKISQFKTNEQLEREEWDRTMEKGREIAKQRGLE